MGKQAPPALRYARLVAVASLRAGPSRSLPGQASPNAERGPDWTPIRGPFCVPIDNRVVRSTRTGRLDFYYRIRNTQGPGAVRGIATAAYGAFPLRVGYRLDGLGTVPPRIATRSPAPGALVTFEITDPPVSCAQHQETRFMLIRTPVQAFHPGGKTQIIATTGDEISVPTVMP